MKRIHIHVGVEDLEQSISFYSALFGADPVRSEADYARWVLDDPRVNFAISRGDANTGVDHLGLQVDDDHELEALRSRLHGTGLAVFDEGETVCCYARSNKSWVEDPAGVAWEAFRTLDEEPVFSPTAPRDNDAANPQPVPPTATKSCCVIGLP